MFVSRTIFFLEYLIDYFSTNCWNISVWESGAYGTLSVWGAEVAICPNFWICLNFGRKVWDHFPIDSPCKLIPHFLTIQKLPEFSGKLPEFWGDSCPFLPPAPPPRTPMHICLYIPGCILVVLSLRYSILCPRVMDSLSTFLYFCCSSYVWVIMMMSRL